MNFCMCGVSDTIAKLIHGKVKKMWRFLCADMVDFCRPGHISAFTSNSDSSDTFS